MELAFSGNINIEHLVALNWNEISPEVSKFPIFRAVADQLYGDQEMHPCVRAQCMDYIQVRNTIAEAFTILLSTWSIMYWPQGNSDHYAQFVSEPIEIYVERKRALTVHGNHLEIQVQLMICMNDAQCEAAWEDSSQ